MPSLKKTLFFLLSAMLTAISIGLLGYAMSTTWSTTIMDCEGFGSNNGSAEITMGLFNGKLIRNTCPSFGSEEKFEVFKALLPIEKAPLVLHGLCVGLLAVCFLTSGLSILISLYNSVSNPYETYMGPNGVYTCSSISACSSVLVLIIYVLNLILTKMQEELVPSIADITDVELTQKRLEVRVGYFLLIPYAVLSLLAILLIYLYDHAAYTHRREQERPTEDAPKEIMMY
ncbi:clarin-3 [Poeciliopsis prolifica]|uniref:clarin-3 n=1 Tax=Poeciliopsis prolifica TaxID=188132 RepID=UPI002413953B|nr:clarin-3 [Poeciliopsis prolifica]